MVTSIQIGKNGRLGNQLFQIAALVGYGCENDLTVNLPTWYCELTEENFEKYFPNYKSENIILNNDTLYYNEFSFSYNKIPKKDNINLNGYFQSYKYFDFCEGEIKKLFTPTINAEKKDDKYVSLHIRRGDYIKHSSSHSIIGSNYYWDAYKYFGEDKIYLVFSDADENEAFSIIPFIKNKVYMSNNKSISSRYMLSDKNVLIDLFEMSSCNKHIIANSSLSWWGAWLGDGETVAPKNWFTRNYGAQIGYKEEDLLLDKWVKF